MEVPQKPHQWVNINTLLDDVAAEIEVGQIVGTDKLTLYNAMSALEVWHCRKDVLSILFFFFF